MDTRRQTIPLIITGLLILALPVTLLADEPETKDKESTIIIIGDDGDEVVIEMEEVQEIVAEAMAGMDDVLAELEDMQFQVRLGRDNRLDLSYEDTTFELDLDQIMTQVASAMQAGFREFDTDGWTHEHDRWSRASDDDLREELEDLRKEMKELRRELRKLKASDED